MKHYDSIIQNIYLKPCLGVPLWCKGLRIQHCHCSAWVIAALGSLLQHGFDPWPGNFQVPRAQQKIKIKIKNLSKCQIENPIDVIFHCKRSNVILLLFFLLLGLQLRHMEVPRLGIESELQQPATPQPQQRQISAASVVASHGSAGSLTH